MSLFYPDQPRLRHLIKLTPRLLQEFAHSVLLHVHREARVSPLGLVPRLVWLTIAEVPSRPDEDEAFDGVENHSDAPEHGQPSGK